MKKIIVPIDFSDYSEHALQTASFFAKKFEAQIIAVNFLDVSASVINQADSVKSEQIVFKLKLAQKQFKEFLQKEYLKGISIKPLVKSIKDFNLLNNIAIEENADLIIMGSHGVYGLKEMFIGSNTEKVVRNSTIPVLVTKGVAITSDFKTSIFACDFSEDDIVPYQKAKNLLELLDCKMQLLLVNTPNGKFKSTKEQEKMVADFLQKADGNLDELDNIGHISEYSVEEGILDFANTNGKDLIIMATHGKKGIEHFIDGSISEDVANHATLPVLTFRI